MSDRVPPHNLEAEEATLGGMLLSPRLIVDVANVVTPDDFYRPAHAAICRVLFALADDAVVDLVTVAAALGAKLDEVGGRQRLLELQAVTPASNNAPHHARIVADAARARRAIDVARRLEDAGYDADLEAIDALAADVDLELRPAFEHVETFDLDDLAALAREDDLNPAKPWIVPGLFRQHEKLIITGGEGFGKSTVLRQFAVCAASGVHPLLGVAVGDLAPARALIVDLQEDQVDLAQAVAPLRKKAGTLYERGFLRAVSRPQGINLLSPRDVNWFESLLDDFRPSLVVMGPLVRLFRATGGRSRYSEDLVDELTDTLDVLIARYDFGLLLEGHAGNDRSEAESWRPRGSSVWRSWPTFGLGFEPIGTSPRKVKVHHWRGARHTGRLWPRHLVGGGGWPWGLDDTDFEATARGLGLDWLIDGNEQEAAF